VFKDLRRELLVALRVTLVLAAVSGLIYPLAMTGIAQVAFPGQANGSLIKDARGATVGSSLIGQCFYQPNRRKTDYLETTPFETGKSPQMTGEVFFAVDPRYFQGRPSYTQISSLPAPALPAGQPASPSKDGGHELVPLDPPCQASNSQGSNLGASSPYLVQRIDTYADYLHCLGVDASVPFPGSQLAAVARDPSRYCADAATDTTPIPVDLVTGDFTSFDPDISQASALAQVSMVARARGIDPTKLTQLVNQNLTGRSLGIFGEPYLDVLQLNLALNREFGPPSPLR
jgi:K+-transporting ATPase ATPase C chain